MVQLLYTPFDCVDGYNTVILGSGTSSDGEVAVYHIIMQASEYATVQFQAVPEDTTVSPTNLTGMLSMAAGTGMTILPLPFVNVPFMLQAGEDLVLWVSSAGTVSLYLYYVQD